MNKDLKKFIILLITSIIVAFAVSYSYSAYQNYKQEKKLEKIKNAFSFGDTNNVEKEEVNPKENWQNEMFKSIEDLGYIKVDIRPFYKRLFDKLAGKKVYNYKSINNENGTLTVEVKDNKIIEKFFNADKEVLEQELIANEDYSSYDLKSQDFEAKTISTFKDILGKDTYLNTKNGITEFEDGKTIEFTHQNGVMNGPAVENLVNGDKIEFNYVNGKRYGEAQKYFANGDREDFIYGENELKNGASIYHFANGEKEEVAYKDGVLEGPAIYIFKDGWAEHYEYKNGKRVED